MTENRILAYLLEELPEEEAAQFEDECFASEHWPAQIELVEEDLIDDYLRGELTPERRQHFEQNYLTTAARQQRVRMAAALLRQVDQTANVAAHTAAAQAERKTWLSRLRDFWNGRNWMPRAAVAFAALVIVLGALWFSIPRTADPVRDGADIARLELSMSNSDRAEGARASTLKLPLAGDALRLVLTLPEELTTTAGAAAGYRVQVENTDGEIKFSQKVQPVDARKVAALIPAAQLARDAYAVKLFAVQPDGSEQRVAGSYRFNIE